MKNLIFAFIISLITVSSFADNSIRSTTVNSPWTNNGDNIVQDDVTVGVIIPVKVTATDVLAGTFNAQTANVTGTATIGTLGVTNNGTIGGDLTVSGAAQSLTARALSGIFAQNTGAIGSVDLITGTSTLTGYIDWRLPSASMGGGTRLGYMGSDSTDITLNLENSADFVVSGGDLTVSGKVGIGAATTSTDIHSTGAAWADGSAKQNYVSTQANAAFLINSYPNNTDVPYERITDLVALGDGNMTTGGGALRFSTNPGNGFGTTSIEAMMIHQDGDIDMANDLTVSGTGNFTGALTAASYEDNTPDFSGTLQDAADAVMNIKGKDGKIDHDTLPDQAHVIVDVTEYFFDVEIDGATVETVEGKYSPEIVDVTAVIPAVEYSIEDALEDSFKTVNKMVDESYQAEEIYNVTETFTLPITVSTNNIEAVTPTSLDILQPLKKIPVAELAERVVSATRMITKIRKVPAVSSIKRLPPQLTKAGMVISPTQIVYATETIKDGKKLKSGIQFTNGKFIKPAKVEKIGTKDARLVRLAAKHNVNIEDIKIVDRTVVEQESRRNLGMMISLHNKALQYALTRIAAIEAALKANGIEVK